MHPFEQIFDTIRGADNYREKGQLIEYLYKVTENRKSTLDAEDRRALADFALAEARPLPALIEATEDTAKRDDLCTYADFLPALWMLTYRTPDDLPADCVEDVRVLGEVLRRERFLENAVDEAFENGVPTAMDMDRLLCVVAPLHDEYRKGKFFVGILHYRDQVARMDAAARAKLASYTASELRRYLDMESFDQYVSDALEMVVDAASIYLNDELAELIGEVMFRGNEAVMYFSLQTLLRARYSVPKEEEVVDFLARNLEYADLVYQTLKEVGKTALFPAELSHAEYLAKSNMTHWLMYPTELGKAPDEIEYLGQVKKGLLKGEIYHILRFKSESDTLDEAQKGKWLLGWANDDGGTFSNFDLYDDYAAKTPEATLKNIKRKLL